MMHLEIELKLRRAAVKCGIDAELAASQVETIIERAAILEFDGKLKREEAEREALIEWQLEQRKTA